MINDTVEQKATPLFETDRYIVRIGFDSEGDSGYEIVNKLTNVVEQKTTIWPNAIYVARDLTKACVQLDEELADAVATIMVPKQREILVN